MNYTITAPKALINTTITLPASKSISNRLLLLNALSYSPYAIENLSESDDTRVMQQAMASNSNTFDVGAAGTSMRFLTAFLAKTVGEWTITGSERMKQRPIRILVDALNQLGGKVEYIENKGFPPLKIFGSALTGGEISLNGGISSQYISALMMIAPYMQKGLKINLQGNVISTPYILMTKKMMEDFGVKIDFSGDKISIRPQIYNPVRFRVESDWSAASYWYEILSLSGKGKIRLKGLKKESYQGDSEIAEIFKSLGVTTEYAEDGVILLPNKETLVKNFFLDFTNIPDLAQTVAVTCCLKDITFIFSGLQSLKIKETNRIEALIHELRKLGYVLHEPAEGTLAWNGEKCTADEDPVISTYEDHRMAMAFAPAALLQSVTIRNPSVVSKSYPNFWHDISLISM